MSPDYLAHLRAESDRFAAVLRDGDLDARVPTCPDWTAGDLLYHLAETFLFWARDIEQRADDPDPIEAAKPPKPADRDELFALYERCTAELINNLQTTPDDVRVWTWSDDQSVGFIRRRMSHEALIHRLDAELTVNALSDVDPALATDGVHEVLQHLRGGAPAWSTWEPGGAFGRVQTTDTGAAWLVQLGDFSGLSPNTGKTYDHEPCLELVASGEPTFAVSGTARDLDAWLWNRPPLAQPSVEGSAADFAAFETIVATSID